jgi:hypothetical protein
MHYVLHARAFSSLPSVAKSHGWGQLPPFGWEVHAGMLIAAQGPDDGHGTERPPELEVASRG